MFNSKKDIDRHVKTSLAKLPENEKFQRGLAIARQYFKLGEYASAEHWLSCFLTVQEDSAQAHKLLGQCYEKQKKTDRAITSYQRSLQLDSKQTGLITDVCKLLLSDDNFSRNLSKAKHWCDIAETERINHEAVLNLKLKVANKDNATDNKLVKEIILKEICARPLDPGLRIRLVKHFVDEKMLDDAFKYCFDIEMKFAEMFQQSVEWANAISSMLTKYAEAKSNSVQSNWGYWLLSVMTLDRQIYLNLLADSSLQAIKQCNIKEISSLLFELDQLLGKFSEKGKNSCPHKQLAEEFLRHYRGQLMLHSASLLFKNEKYRGKSRDITTKCLPLLFLAYQCGVPDSDELWLKHTNENIRHLWANWKKQASYRCCQAGNVILSCVDESVDASVIAQIQSVTDSKIWNTAEDLVNQVRQFCSDINWKKHIFRALYSSSGDQLSKLSSSYFMQSTAVSEPDYVLPKREHLQMYLEMAQYLFPSSLPYQVYLGLGLEDLSELRCKSFSGLTMSTNNLDNCNVETLNQLDVDSFLYCSILVAQSCLNGERKYQDDVNTGRPLILPGPNMIPGLCEEDKMDWWNAACSVFKNTNSEGQTLNKQLLQHGLQAVRGTGTPITDVLVLLKLGKILAKRASCTVLPEERRQLELRAESVYKSGVLLWKIRNEASFSSTNIFFKYGMDSFECNQESIKLAESALTYLAGVYFKHGRYEEFTHDFGGIPLPFAAYYRAEAFKKLDESNKAPLKTKKFYSERARDCIKQTQKYLELPYIEKSHPLHYVVNSEMKRLQLSESLDGSFNSSMNGFGAAGVDDSDHFQSFSSSANTGLNRSDREVVAKTNELEGLMRKMMETLNFVKEDILNIRNDVGDIQERLVKIEDNIYKKTSDDDATAAAAVFNDLYMLDELQNPSFVNQPTYNQTIQQLTPNLPPGHSRISNHQAAAAAAAAVAMQQQNPYQQFYNTSYPMYMQQYAQQQGRAQIGAVASPMHAYQDSNLLAPATPAAYYQQQTQAQPSLPQVSIPHHQQIATTKGSALIEQALQTPTLLNTWNSTYNSNHPSTSTPHVPALLDKAPPVNVVITSSDPLPTNISLGTTQPTYSVTIPPQHIKHSVVNNTVTGVTSVVPSTASGIENISPVGQQTINTKFPMPAPKATVPAINPGMFSQNIINAVSTEEVEKDEDDENTANISGEYDPRPDFQPIIALPDEVEVKTGEENEEMIFCGRSKLLRMVDKEWKERGLGDLKILKSKSDPSKYRIVMRRDQVHKIAANHSISPELIIKPMEKNNKCYMWAAMDFADEEPKKETFCARFATAELAKEFHDKFNKAKEEIIHLKKQKEKQSSNVGSVPALSFGNTAASNPTNKPLFGSLSSSTFGTTGVTSTPATTSVTTSSFQGFTFTNNFTPKTQVPTINSDTTNKEPSKPSPFASFTFGGSKSVTSATAGNESASVTGTPPVLKTPEKIVTTSETDETVEDFIPTADFKPVIPLPDLIEVKTGEEGFDCVYEHRAKMYRMDREAKEWKERGIGNIRVLVKKDDNNTVRLLMRREQVLKLCCNQLITKDMKFTLVEKTKSLTWVGHDYSENELTVETFAIRFKTKDILDDFYNTLKKIQSAMSDKSDSKANKEEVKKLEPKGFGDVFKPKAGAWTCDACYVSNKAEDLHCISCASPKDPTVPKKESNILDLSKSTSKFKFGAQPATEAAKFNFGVPTAPTKPAESAKKEESKGFGDQFKPKAGSWTCSGCYVSNKGDDLYCLACDTPKDPTVPKKEDKVGGETPKFNFVPGGGFTFATTVAPQTTSNASVPSVTNSNTMKGGFGFGSTPASGFSFGSSTVPAPATTTASQSGFRFGLPKPTMSFGSTLSEIKSTEDKPVSNSVLPAPEKSTFEFVFKPKSPGKSKSPARTLSVGSENAEGEVEEGDGCAEEENNTYFTPVIPLPEKVDVKTGEEDEDVLYSHRAKLYRFVDKEWKERGIGDVKILKHRTSGKLRVLMRRDQVLKICLNHALDTNVEYQKKDDKSWQFLANDFSEGTFEVMNFSLRFKTSDIAKEFRDAIKRALSGELFEASAGTESKHDATLDTTISTPNSNFNFSQLSDISLNDKELAASLKLPENFFDSPAQPCSGCRGCESDSFKFPNHTLVVNKEVEDEKPLPTSVKDVKPIAATPILSKSPKKVSFTDTTADKTVASIFSSLSTKTETTSLYSINSFVTAEKQSSASTIFGGSAKQAEQSTPKSIFGGISANSGQSSTGSIFSSSLNTTPKTVLMPSQSSSDKAKSPLLQPSVFGSASPASNKSMEGVKLFGTGFGQNAASPSIFGGSSISPAVVKEDSSTTYKTNASTPIFGSVGTNSTFSGFSNTTPKSVFGTDFSNTTGAAQEQKLFGSGGNNNMFSFADAAKGFDKNGTENSTVNKSEPDFLKNVESGVSFAALASGNTSNFLTKQNAPNSGFVGLTVKEDFFTRMANKTKHDSSGGADHDDGDNDGAGAEENYDPHYEPIIQLPDEIEVRTGEEDEMKIFGERTKLYRFDSDTKEWKERGVGELKVLHHPVHKSYRLLMRREQIFKLVLNQAVTDDLQISSLNNSSKAFSWAAMNHAEEGPQLEHLAVRFKNEEIASTFKAVVEQCQDKLRKKSPGHD
ncbi:E3 SUMO-protein ligase RanBP2 isoform X2 [Malaya genurostris]|uniref:E3 SUMO-protein ligase RanBP2 isoform X2 n=1 Tax=Malaya genurostris TaxID=325434 RepID=UPI0026F3FDD5|nr:E3 SUMO-protein ligase RanBP2 isoform X2 [Malaya genurostris]